MLSMQRYLAAPVVVVALLLSWSCARAQVPEPVGPKVVLSQMASSPAVEPEGRPAEPAASMPVRPSPEERREALRRQIQATLDDPVMQRARVSIVVRPLTGDALFEVEPDARRVPASNVKLLTSVAALRALPGRYHFVTEYRRAGGRLYIHGNGDPVLRGRELVALGQALRARGVGSVRGIVVDDSYFDRRRRLAPGFESFGEGAYYRPTSGALNVSGNAITVKVSAPRDRRRPRVDVYPPSDYVIVRKLVRFAPTKGKGRGKTHVSVKIQPRGSIMWVTVTGQIPHGAPAWRTRRAVYDPALATGWAVRRALAKAGATVSGSVWRGRAPAGAALVLRRERPLASILAAVNTHSDNLAAETLVRAMGSRDPSTPAGSWERGLQVLRQVLEPLGLTEFSLGNGSGLHRHSWVTARLMTDLLRTILSDAGLRRVLLPTLAVAGRSGTLAPRLRGTAAEGLVRAKTGTLGGALALSGYVDPEGPAPLVFSILVNGRSDHAVRDRMDHIATLLARHVRSLPLEGPSSQAASQPASQPSSQPSSQPVDDEDE